MPYFHYDETVRLPKCCKTTLRVSQVPQSLYPYTLSPVTPRSQLAACEYYFTNGGRLRHLRKIGHSCFVV